MKLSKTARFNIHLMINIIIIITEIIGLIIAIIDDNPPLHAFTFYTNLANLFFLIGTSIITFLEIRYLAAKKGRPHNFYVLKYASLINVCITAVLVITVIAPFGMLAEGTTYTDFLFKKSFLFLHTLCPLLGAINFFAFEKKQKLSIKEMFSGIIFIELYMLYICLLMGFFPNISAPYPFVEITKQPVIETISYLIGFSFIGLLFSWLIMLFNNLHYKIQLKNEQKQENEDNEIEN